jgi:putative ABC transport system permease protein
MLRSYLKLALRNISREITYSSINILGLTMGIVSSMFIFLWVTYEWSFDEFYPNKENIVRIYRNTVFADRVETRGEFPYRGAEEMLKYPQVEKACVVRLNGGDDDMLLSTSKTKTRRTGGYGTPAFLEIFQYTLLKGRLEGALDDPYSIVITARTAKALFGDEDPINKNVRYENKYDLRVTAVIDDIPVNSSIRFACIVPFALFEIETPWAKDCLADWDCDWFRVYLQLHTGTDLDALNQSIVDMPAQHAGQHPTAKEQMFLYPMERWHMHKRFENGVEAGNDRADDVEYLTLLAIIILLVACINFMNLATARSARRGREVGIRKVTGSSRLQIIYRFLGESILITSIAFMLALVIGGISLPLFSSWMNIPLTIDYSSWKFWLCSISGVLLIGVTAGSYPAFYLSSFLPVKVLTSKTGIGRSTSLPRKLLVISQFGVSILLVLGSIAVRQQVKFGLDRELGFDKEGLITVRDNKELSEHYEAIKQELISSGAASAVVKTNSPVTDVYEVNYLTWDSNPGPPIECTNIFTEYDYAKTLAIKMVLGRDFSPEHASDSTGVIFNETAAEMMGFENPIGEEIFIGDQRLRIIGIMEDVLMGDPYDRIYPLYMVLQKDWPSLANRANITIRLTSMSRLAEAEKIFMSHAPANPFEYRFVDEAHKEKFAFIGQVAGLTNLFAFLAIVIAAMGLFGLATFTAEQRQKEMSIRKVLGASVARIVSLLSKDFARLIVIAFVLFAPAGAWLIDDYLDRYLYRIEISWWMYLASAVLIFFVTMVIVGRQALRAATMNPVESLRNE